MLDCNIMRDRSDGYGEVGLCLSQYTRDVQVTKDRVDYWV